MSTVADKLRDYAAVMSRDRTNTGPSAAKLRRWAEDIERELAQAYKTAWEEGFNTRDD